MSNLTKRLLVFAIGLPAVAATAFLAPDWNYPVFALLAVAASALGAAEMRGFLPRAAFDYRGSMVVAGAIGALVPAVGYLTIIAGLWRETPALAGMAAAAAVLWIQVWRRRPERFVLVVPSVTSHLFMVVYPGVFAWYAVRLTTLPNAAVIIAVFFLAVYLNDSTAFAAGMLFGRKEPVPVVAVSPNKSRIGFVGGFAAGVFVVVMAGVFYPHVFGGHIWRRLVFGSVVALAAIVGDLAESALKRSAQVKDSGDLIPGRGGLLDSIDSPLFAAPFFYYGYVLLFA